MTTAPSPLTRRLAIAGVCVLSLAGALALAWWQWERFSSASGTFQNLGYVLQWPLFGLFPAFMFWRIRRLRQRSGETSPPPAAERQAPQAPAPTPRKPPAGEDPVEDELAAYNRYLAELNAKDREQHPRKATP